MVNKQVIENIITKAIISAKCLPKYFSKSTRKVMDKFQKETVDLDHERALYLDNDGNILWEKEGNYSSVTIDWKLAWKLSASENIDNPLGYGQINIEHNHPTVLGFDAFPPVLSRGDTDKMLSYANDGYLFRSITAESNGKRMSIIRKPDVNAETSMHQGDFDRHAYEEAQIHLDKAITQYIQMYGDKLAEYNHMPKSELMSYFKKGEQDKDTRTMISQKCINEIGSLQSLLESSGVVKEMDKCGFTILLEE